MATKQDTLVFQVSNNKTKIIGDPKTIGLIREDFKVRSPNAFFSPAYRTRKWDGFIRYITDVGNFDTGLLPDVLGYCEKHKLRIEIQDRRDSYNPPEVASSIGEFNLRPYQADVVAACISNKIHTLSFPRGIVVAATNSGKNLMIASIFKSFPEHTRGIVLLKEKEWYETSVIELSELLGEEVGYLNAKSYKPGRLLIAMMPTLYSKLTKPITKVEYSKLLAEIDLVIADEGDTTTSNQFKTVLLKCSNSYARYALSGTALMGKYKKDLLKHYELKKFFGDKLVEITNDFMISKGYSTKPLVVIVKGNREVEISGDYQEEYTQGIVQNKARNKRILRRAKYHAGKGRYPMLIICKRHEHIEKLAKLFKKELPGVVIEAVHHKTENRKDIIQAFTKGNIEILIASHIVKRAKNFPLIRYLCNASAGDSEEDIVQMVGRGLRTHESKSRIYIDDFHDTGAYLLRHSRHRIKYYKTQKFKVIQKY
jgi:ATP-dependent helicase IRC3